MEPVRAIDTVLEAEREATDCAAELLTVLTDTTTNSYGSLEDFCHAAQRGEKAYQYEQAVSVFAVQDCMALWGVV